jgi:D-tyrosyl-tRNA(Tyr) deacylase
MVAEHPARCREGEMRVVVQRVMRADVRVKGEAVAAIDAGLLLYVAFRREDREPDLDWMAEKVVSLRIFEDASGKMNRSITEGGGQILVVSQFTLYGDARRGRRPSFDAAAPAGEALALFEKFVDRLRASGLIIKTGSFRQTMQVTSINDGPVTILLDSPAVQMPSESSELGHGSACPRG